jgi:protein TonB
VKQDPDTRAIISADQSLPYGRVMHLIDLVKGEGIAKFALNIEKDAQAASPTAVSEAVLIAPESAPGPRALGIRRSVARGARRGPGLADGAPGARRPRRRLTELVMIEVERPAPPPASEAKPEPPSPSLRGPQAVQPKLDPRCCAASAERHGTGGQARRAAAGGRGPHAAVHHDRRAASTRRWATRSPASRRSKAVDPASVKPIPVPLYELDSQPTVIGDVRIPYPEDARSRGVEGTVVLSVLVDETGQVRAVKVVSGPGSGLDQAAAKAVERIRFRPAIRKGKPVPAQITYRYTFLLD